MAAVLPGSGGYESTGSDRGCEPSSLQAGAREFLSLHRAVERAPSRAFGILVRCGRESFLASGTADRRSRGRAEPGHRSMGAETVERRTLRRDLISGGSILVLLTAVAIGAAVLLGAADIPWREILHDKSARVVLME